jgi:RecA-family ATPase
MTARDLDRARDALQSLDPNCDRPTWVKIGMASHAAGLSFDDFNDWSAGADSYNAQACRATWRSFKTASGGVGAGSLFGMARDNGWTESHQGAKPFVDYDALLKRSKPAEPPRPQLSSDQVKAIFDRFEPATDQHPYCLKKGIVLGLVQKLRVVPLNDPMEHRRGWLVVPTFDADGKIQSMQFVPCDGGGKMSLKDAPMSGGRLDFGPASSPVTVIVEGLGHIAAVYAGGGGRAISTFGSSNIRRVVESLRQREPNTSITLLPDRGKESDAFKIAREFNCKVACLPEVEPSNFDVNDLYLRDGYEAVLALLDSAVVPEVYQSEPPGHDDQRQDFEGSASESDPAGDAPKVHPLARYVDFDGTVRAPRWVIPGFIGHGVCVISGAGGCGKTTALLPLALVAAGLHGDELLPVQWRHVIYATEDVEQARRILAGIVGYSNLNISLDLVRERVHLVEAVRLDPVFVASVGKDYRAQFTRTVEGVEVPPLVVLDTKSAVLQLENENDNSETSRMMAALKQGFDGLPVWLIAHVAKASLSRADALSSRGASAGGDDANQTIFLVREGENRYLVLGKTRFEPKWPELEIVSHTAQTTALDEFGNTETIVMRWGIAAPAQQTRAEAADKAAELERQREATALRGDIRDAVQVAWLTGNPLGREGVKAKVNKMHSAVIACIENLLSEQWLYEVAVPAKQRLHPNKRSFFVSLTTEEHEAVLDGADLPADKLVIPKSWQKQAVSSMREPEHECASEKEVSHAES